MNFRLLLIIFLVTCYFNLFSQSDIGYVEVYGTAKIARRPIENAKINIYENGIKGKVYNTNINGKFNFKLDINKSYVIEVAKQGLVAKRISFDTHVPENEIGIWTYKFAIELFPMIEGFDISLLKNPIAKINFDNNYGEFDFDTEYTESMLRRIDKLLKEYENLRIEAYKKTIAKADILFNNEDYDDALKLYDLAIDYNPYDEYPGDMIHQIRRILSKKEAREKAYQKAINEGDKNFSFGNYEGAKTYYVRALNYKKNAEYPKQKLSEIEELLANLNADDSVMRAKEKAFREAMFTGDDLRKKKQYIEARESYRKALSIKPEEQLPKDNIAELDIIIAKLMGKDADQKAKEEAYKNAITAADADFNLKKYISAKSYYEKALTFLPYQEYPKKRLRELNKLIAENEEIEQQYNKYITEADNAFNVKNYKNAKANYNNALEVKPNEIYPKTKLDEINKIIADQQGKDVAYNEALKSGDIYFRENKYESAKSEYQNALNLKPNELYPKERIEKINSILSKHQDIKNNYNTAIINADLEFNNKNYSVAKTGYENALSIKSDEQYPQAKINEINQILASLKQNKKQYNNLISEADRYFNSKYYEDSKSKYNEALTLFPEEQYPKDKISEIDNILLASKSEKEQKLAKENSYKDAINKGDNYFSLKEYVSAKTEYEKALSIKPKEKYPKSKISEILKLLDQQNKLDSEYSNIIAQADNSFNLKRYRAAKESYEKALELIPEKEYPKNKITEIDQILNQFEIAAQNELEKGNKYKSLIEFADNDYKQKKLIEAKLNYQKALEIKPDEQYPVVKINEIDKLLTQQKNVEENYNSAIANADKLFNEKHYKMAKSGYETALSIKSNEQYPKSKITEIEQILVQIKQNRKIYNKIIVDADKLFNSKNYEDAKIKYNEALNLFADEEYPKNKISEIDMKLLAQKNAEEQKIAKEQAYKNAISKGDNLFSTADYTKSKIEFEKALQLKPNESYPKSRINEIIAKLDELNKLNAEYNKQIALANKDFGAKKYSQAKDFYKAALKLKPSEEYPKNKITEIDRLITGIEAQEKEYSNFIAAGNKYFSERDYENAKINYQKALDMKPNEVYPKNKISEINNILKQTKLAEQKRLENEKKYKEVIVVADKYFNSMDYSTAKISYQEALTYKSDANYPRTQIAEIDKKLKAMQLAELARKEEEKRKKLEESQASFNKNDFDFAGEKRSSKFLSDLAKKYPEGITRENYKKKNKAIKRVIVNRSGIAKEYIEVKYSYGTYYFRNGQNISKSVFYSETKD
ncbi:MAG: hypothetical protein KAT68_01850 [Bacteroidales bacterium]|nr:hypothetical protein [Bacteroidales bacterium]